MRKLLWYRPPWFRRRSRFFFRIDPEVVARRDLTLTARLAYGVLIDRAVWGLPRPTSERLAALCGVGRTTIRAALRQLQAKGLIVKGGLPDEWYFPAPSRGSSRESLT